MGGDAMGGNAEAGLKVWVRVPNTTGGELREYFTMFRFKVIFFHIELFCGIQVFLNLKLYVHLIFFNDR